MYRDITGAASFVIFLALSLAVVSLALIPIVLLVYLWRQVFGQPQPIAENHDPDLYRYEARPVETPPPSRMFNAPATAQWRNFFDYWQYRLWEYTAIRFNTSPGRLMFGSVLILAIPATIVGVPLALLIPNGWPILLVLWGIALVMGLIGGYLQSQPLDWFDGDPPQGPPPGRPGPPGGIAIGKEQ